MSFLFGGGHRAKPQYSGIQVQSSSSVLPLPLAWGMMRLAPNLIWYGNFQAHKAKQKGGKGLTGKGGQSFTYSASLVMALCLGPINGIVRVFKGQEKPTSFSSIGFSLFTGAATQTPWGYLTASFPAQALSYPYTAYLAAANYDLGNSNSLPPHTFEVQALRFNSQTGVANDADPAPVFLDLLTAPVFGAGFPTASINTNSITSTAAAATTGDNALQTYCRANGFAFSPAIIQQTQASGILDQWARVLNCAVVWDGNQLSIVPYSLDTITANGVTFLPVTASVYTLTDDDFIHTGDDPVKIKRHPPEDAFNSLRWDILDRNNEYNPVPVLWKDQALIDQFGFRDDSVFTAHEICIPAMGKVLCAMMGQRQAFEQNEYEIKLSAMYCLITPMDKLTITDPILGTIQIRVEHISEDDAGILTLLCRQVLLEVNSAESISTSTVTNTPNNLAVSPGAVNPPIIFEPPSSLATVAQVWAAVSGGDGTTANANWGGAYVHVSTDNVTFQQIGTITAPARMGKTTTALAAYGGANPDITNSLGVTMLMSSGDLTSVTAVDAANNVTLCYVDGEFLSFRDVTLTGPSAYTLGGQLYRGQYSSAPASHLTNKDFARLDSNIFKYNLPANEIGKTLYFKFQSINIFGGGVQDISTCTVYTLVPSGAGYGTGTGGVPAAPATPTAAVGAGTATLSWTPNVANDNVTGYEVWRATGASQPFSSATKIGTSTSSTYVDVTATAGTAYTYFLIARNAVGTSLSPGTNVTTSTSASKICRFYGSVDGRPDPAQELFDVNMTGDEVFAAGFPSNLGGCDVAPTGTVVFSITKNGVQVGTMNIAAGATTATWTLASGFTFAAGDKFGMYAPTTQDPTMSRVHYTLVGTRT